MSRANKDPKPVAAGGIHIRPVGAFVYRIIDANGEYLYVGLTNDVLTRMNGHRRTAPWWPEAHTVSWEEYATRDEAARMEHALIHLHRPRYNERGTQPPRIPLHKTTIRDEMFRAEATRRVSR